MTDELERKLRSALTEMAEEVRPSHHPWAEHQRRLSARKSRRPFLMAAAAAAVVALIAVPVLVLQMRPDPLQAADIPEPSSAPTAPTETTGSPGLQFPSDGTYQPQAGEKVLTQPVVVQQEETVKTLAYTTERDGKRFLCLAQAAGEQDKPVINGPGDSICSPLSPPRAGKYVWGSRQVTSPKQPGQVLYVASPPADSILVRTAEGAYAGSVQIAKADDFVLFAVYLNSNKPPAAFTARDKAKATLENG